MLTQKVFQLFFVFLVLILPCKLKAQTLELQNIVVYPTDYLYEKALFGGISGLTWCHEDQSLWAVSDDRAQNGHARIYQLQVVEKKDHSLDVKILQLVELKTAQGGRYLNNEIDAEALACTREGEFFISSEGDLKKTPALDASIMQYRSDGSWISNFPLPAKMAHLPYPNLAHEAMAYDERGPFLYFAPENPYQFDGQMSSPAGGQLLRLQEWKLNDKKIWMPSKQWAYPLDAVEEAEGDNGLVELVVVAPLKLLALERSYLPKSKKNIIKLYQIDLNKNGLDGDVTNVESLKNYKGKVLDKKLIANFDQFLAQMPESQRRLDNMEAMTLIPGSKEGEKLLLVGSDNNFKDSQRTLFMLFRYTP